MTKLPLGFGAYVANIGIKDSTDDLVVIAAHQPVPAAGVFTLSRFAGPSVTISREHLTTPTARAVAIISKNANVANGPTGVEDAHAFANAVAAQLGCEPTDVLIASTGVIGRPYPMDRVLAGIANVPAHPDDREAEHAARGIMTTDTVCKVAEADVAGSTARVVGIAKGVGMIEPNMATMIAVILTDAEVAASELEATFRRTVDTTFNCVSIDSDTSTSDSAVVLASGLAGPADPAALEVAIHAVCQSLTLMIARDGEGAQKLIEVVVDQARDGAQAKRVARAIVNSPLVKTAVHGADPNWGRVAMAIGKCSDDVDIDQDRVTIRFGTTVVYPTEVDEGSLDVLAEYMRGDSITIHVSLATGVATATMWGCDLTDGYIRINADYTT